ncbi:MAG TPA: amidohydrolase family protein, partial [Chloroflexota bacterium]|nr:amidohydrolase family protein [Chloroflexota bacterium]
ILNMVVEGLFDQFPTLRIACVESGFTWLPGLMWRIDKEWKGLRRETPWNHQLPSEYIRQHLRFTTQPLDAPPETSQFLDVIDQLGSDDLLMFSTDYPHWHFDNPAAALPPGLSEPLTRKIMADNARAFYRL